ncbi:uncharacterized protein LOC111691404 [Anoplophora glabripennis]|uniref:uncharacterized protein LOC111691404 n=1 Tax=Anoplophora glabripennis TaxID=217634 RepID=UPI000C761370|nr:uncharacterized protein LOC111691404 [Anoplophora glabripennis]
MDLHSSTKLLLTAIFIRGTCSADIPGWRPNYLDTFRFIPVPGDCYQLYHRNDLISSCRREANFENQSCIEWVSGDHECIGLVTPTNETVMFRCTSHIRFDKCFEVYDANQNVSIVCQESVEGHGTQKLEAAIRYITQQKW